MTVHTLSLAPDPMVPALETLIDGSALRSHLDRILPRQTSVTDVRLRRVKYRIGEGLRVVYDVTTTGGSITLSARTFGHRAASVYREASVSAVPSDGFEPVSFDAATGTVWWTLPNDRRLTGLAQVLTPTRRLAAAAGIDWFRSVRAEYNPESRLTVACVDRAERTVAYAKALRPGVARMLVDHTNLLCNAMLASGAPVGLPRAWSPTGVDLMLLEVMPGCHWNQLEPTALPDALAALGASIGHFHRLEVNGLTAHSRLTVPRVHRCLSLIALARPDLAAVCQHIDGLIDRSIPPVSSSVVVHGDLHPKNALFDGNQVRLIDLDQAGTGDPAVDVGSLLARLQYGALIGEYSPAVATTLGHRFLDGYSEVATRPHPSTLRWHTAAALIVERAMRAVNRVHINGLAVLPEVLSDVQLMLER